MPIRRAHHLVLGCVWEEGGFASSDSASHGLILNSSDGQFYSKRGTIAARAGILVTARFWASIEPRGASSCAKNPLWIRDWGAESGEFGSLYLIPPSIRSGISREFPPRSWRGAPGSR